jgi:hypothetical protein
MPDKPNAVGEKSPSDTLWLTQPRGGCVGPRMGEGAWTVGSLGG